MSGSTGTASKFTSELLQGSNWSLWSWKFKLGAQEANCWGIISGTGLEPTPSTAEVQATAINSWNQLHALALHQMAKCVNTEMKLKIMGKDTAKSAWDALQNHFMAKSGHERFRRRQELFQMRLGQFKSMAAFLDAVKQRQIDITAVEGTCSDEDVLYVILAGLPDTFDYASSYIRQQNMNLDAAISYLASEAAAKNFKARDGTGNSIITHIT